MKIKEIITITVIIVLLYTNKFTAQCWQKLEVGDSHALAIAKDGSIWSWGNNSSGRLGIGNTISQNTPQLVSSDNDWMDVSAGLSHSLAIKSNGTLWVWGANNSYQLGIGSSPRGEMSPVQLGTDNNWHKVFAGFENSFAIKTDGSLWAWGRNDLGQLGNGQKEVVSTPIKIGNSNNWLQIESGAEFFTVGLKQDGTLWTWGFNVVGQLGLGDYDDRTFPTQVGSLNNWTKIATARGTGIALNSSGQLFYFGIKIGDNSYSYFNIPTLVNEDRNWIDVSAGLYHATALKLDNSMWGWGENNDFQLGSSVSDAFEALPVLIDNSFKWNALSNGSLNSSAITNEAGIFGFGFNNHGILGNGNNETTAIISQVICPNILSVESSSKNQIHIYPNPAKDFFVLNNLNGFEDIKIYDIKGGLIRNCLAVNSNFSRELNVQVSSLRNGVYFLIIKNYDGNQNTFKLIKQ